MHAVLTYPIRGSKFSFSVEIREHLLSRTTEFQQIDVYDTFCFGKVLTLDGHVQLSTLDERAYHECLVHIPMLSLDSPKRALVVGGGDGGVLRELCRWESLAVIDMVEIDEGVIRAAQEVLPELSAGSFDDPRVNIHVADAFGFLSNVEQPYDLIVMDITDTYEGEEGELSEQLFTDRFHRDTRNALSEDGFLVSQADNHIFCPYSMESLIETFAALYANVGSYQAIVPSFGGISGYVWASKSGTVKQQWPGNKGIPLQYLNAAKYAVAFENLGFNGMAGLITGQ